LPFSNRPFGDPLRLDQFCPAPNDLRINLAPSVIERDQVSSVAQDLFHLEHSLLETPQGVYCAIPFRSDLLPPLHSVCDRTLVRAQNSYTAVFFDFSHA